MAMSPDTPRAPRDERIEIRCHAAEKRLLRRAATIEHRTLSNWLLFIALREARKIVDAHDVEANDRSEPAAAQTDRAGQAPSS